MGLKEFHIGLMRSRVNFKKNNPVANLSGGQGDDYTVIVNTRGFLQKLRGGTNLLTGQIVLSRDYVLMCRFQAAIQIDVDTRVNVDGAEFSIKDFEIVDQIKHIYQFNITKDE